MIELDSIFYNLTVEPTDDQNQTKAKFSFECIGDAIELERLVTVILELTQVKSTKREILNGS